MSRQSGYLEGQLLLAMPGMSDARFDRSVIYLCSHSEEGAMGLVLNEYLTALTFSELLDQLDIETEGTVQDVPFSQGGRWKRGGALCCTPMISFRTAPLLSAKPSP